MSEVRDIVLVVDDEEPVRRTVRDWLLEARLGVDVLTAADAESALQLAGEHTIDLAILDWNLGAGMSGLQLLEDLFVFNSDIVAILITGYAHQATPLDAMRMGVRDYLDKNQNFTRDAFLAAVRKQLERIRPARRERLLHARLVSFREAVEKVLPLVQSAAALSDPLSPPEAVASLFRFLLRATQAGDGVLLVHTPEQFRAYDAAGKLLPAPRVPFARSLAGAVYSLGSAQIVQPAAETAVEWQDFERGRSSLLAAALPAGSGLKVVLELFDSRRPGGFTAEDRQLVEASAAFGGDIMAQALAGRHSHRLLFDAVAAALGASDSLSQTLQGSAAQRQAEPPPAQVMQTLRDELSGPAAEDTLRLAEAIRVLSLRHGSAALRHCTLLVESLLQLLEEES